MAKYWTPPAKYRTPKTSPIQDAPVRQACMHSQAQASTPSSSKTQGRVDDHARVEAVQCVLPRGIPRSLSTFQRRLMRLIAHDALLVPCRCVARTPTAPAGHPCRHSCASSLPSRRHHALWAQSPGGEHRSVANFIAHFPASHDGGGRRSTTSYNDRKDRVASA